MKKDNLETLLKDFCRCNAFRMYTSCHIKMLPEITIRYTKLWMHHYLKKRIETEIFDVSVSTTVSCVQNIDFIYRLDEESFRTAKSKMTETAERIEKNLSYFMSYVLGYTRTETGVRLLQRIDGKIIPRTVPLCDNAFDNDTLMTLAVIKLSCQ